MKKNDLAAIIIIVILATIFSYFIANSVIGRPQTNPVEVEVATPVQANFATPDSRIFNKDAIDPTVDIKGDLRSNSQPFTN